MNEQRDPQFLVWSNEHGAWWGPAKRGYTLDYREAGRYSHVEAVGIVEQASRGGPHSAGGIAVWPEVLVLAPEHRWQGGPYEPEPAMMPARLPWTDSRGEW